MSPATRTAHETAPSHHTARRCGCRVAVSARARQSKLPSRPVGTKESPFADQENAKPLVLAFFSTLSTLDRIKKFYYQKWVALGEPSAPWNMSLLRNLFQVLLVILLSTKIVVARRSARLATAIPDRRINACSKILQSDPLDFNALANRGISYNTIGQYDNALVDLDEAIHLNSDPTALYLERGRAYDGRGDHELAIVDFSEAIRRDASLIVAHFGRAMAYEATGRGELAMVDLGNAMRLNRSTWWPPSTCNVAIH